jgi:hypothetical protein
VHCPGHLLVEQDRPGGPVDADVGAYPQLSEIPGAGVSLDRRLQVVVAALCLGPDDATALEPQRHVGDLHAAGARGHGEVDGALGGILDRPGEDLAAGHVVLAV